jgi:hypothetical protein
MRITMTPASAVLLASAALVASSTLAPHYAAAQSAAPCPTIENDAERLACYDRALRPNPPAKTEAPARAREERAARERATPTANAPAAASAAAPRVATRDRSERREQADRETRVATAAAPPAPPQPAPAAANERSSRRAAHESSQDEVIGTVVIAEVRTFTGRPSTFITDSGEVWTQIDTQRTTLPKTPFSATLKPGAMGSVFLVPENRNRAIRVHQDK